MTEHPFEDENGRYVVLVNDEGQHSLWPVFADVPDGWVVAHHEDTRSVCLAFVQENWSDIRPKSLVEEMTREAGRGSSAP